MLRVAIASTDPSSCRQISDMIHRATRNRGMEVDVKLFEHPDRFLFRYEPNYDIIFLEAVFPLSAVPEIVKRVRRRTGNVDLVILTDRREYGGQIQEGGVLAFIPKVPSEERFAMEFLRSVERMIANTLDQILIKTSNGTIRLNVRQIYYLETRDRMLHYHTSLGVFAVRKSLVKAQQELAHYSFAKCNQCYLVNLIHVSDLRDNCVVVGERELEISRRHRKTFMESMISHIGHV